MKSFTFGIVSLLFLAGTTPAPQDVAFTSTHDNSTQRYILMLPAAFDAAESHDLLIALHGHGSDRRQFATDERDECRAARDAAARYDTIYVCPDYRAKTSWMGPAAEADVLQIVEGLKTQYRVGRVFMCGGSMGGTATLIFAVRHPELLAGIVAMNGTANMVEYENFQDAIAESYGGTKDAIPDEYKARSAEFHADRLTMPVALTTGGQDTVVPPDSVLRLTETLQTLERDVLELHRAEGGHATDYDDAMACFEYVFRQAR